MKKSMIPRLGALCMAAVLGCSGTVYGATGYQILELVEGTVSETGYIPVYDPAEEMSDPSGDIQGLESPLAQVDGFSDGENVQKPEDGFSDGSDDVSSGTEGEFSGSDGANSGNGDAGSGTGDANSGSDHTNSGNDHGNSGNDDVNSGIGDACSGIGADSGTDGEFSSKEADGTGFYMDNLEAFINEEAEPLPSLYASAELPSRYSLIENGWGSPVENQSILGICWAFSSLESVETGLVRSGLAPAGLNLSETHLAYTTYFGTNSDPNDFTGGETFVAAGNRWTRLGGNRFYSTATLARGYGAAYESDFPLSLMFQADGADTMGSKTSILDNVITDPLKKVSVSRLKNAYWLLDINSASTQAERVKRVNAVKNFIYTYGAVETGLRVNGYEAPYDAETNSFYTPYTAPEEEKTPNHSVALVGWDDEKITAAPSPGAFLVQNSWGENAGEHGLFWLSYEDCSMKNQTFYQMEQVPVGQAEDLIIHQYDGTGYNSVIRPQTPRDDLRISGANVFQAREAQYLKKVSFYAGASSLPWTISIYRYVSTTPGTGYLVAEQSGRNQYSGYYTVDLEEPIPIAAGEKFAVQLTFDHKNGYVPHEKGTASYRQFTADYGQSYLYDGSRWVDLMNLKDDKGNPYCCNICIKAMAVRTTDPISDKPSAPVVTSAQILSDNKLTISVKKSDEIVSGYNYVVGTAPDFLTTRKFAASRLKTASTSVTFSRLARGTYYVAVRCYRQNKDGSIAYSPWSQVSVLKVTVNTPAAPILSSVKVTSGNRITAAIKAPSIPADTHVFALGTTADFLKKGKYYKSIKVSGARKATFDYLPQGTWYVAVRSFNSVNGKKIYGAWSKVARIQITGSTPGTPVLSSVKTGKGTLNVSYASAANASLYEYVLCGRKFKAATFNPTSRYKTWTGKQFGPISLTGLKKGTWYFGVRGYTMNGNTKVYGKWAVKKVTIR